MGQNTSHAVMAQRVEAHDSLDHFPTPPWATRALCERLGDVSELLVWEPACGTGDMARPLAEFFAAVKASDVHGYGFGEVRDFLLPMIDDRYERPDWIITNPPFRLAGEFINRGLELAMCGVAMLVRTSFLEGGARYREIFEWRPPTRVLQFVERVPMFKGRLDRSGSTATSYCWLVWDLSTSLFETHLEWIAPCRKRLEREDDYPEAA